MIQEARLTPNNVPPTGGWGVWADVYIKYKPRTKLPYDTTNGAGSSTLRLMMGDLYGVRTLATGMWTEDSWGDYRQFIYNSMSSTCTMDTTAPTITCYNLEDIQGNSEYEMWIV
jgi:hypothetical protein